MVYRQAPLESCAVCKVATDRGCPRCGKPLCRAHCPPPHRRCDTCEAEFVALTDVYQVDADPVDPTLPDLGHEGSGMIRAFATLARWITIRRLRRRFLRERPADLKMRSE